MGHARRLHWNIASNTLNTAVNAAAGLITLPVLISRLGAEGYGLWVMVTATAGMFTVMDFGVSAAVGRHVAAHLHNGTPYAISRVVSTSLCLLVGLALAVAMLTLALVQLFPLMFPIPPEKVADVQTALLVSGMASALYFPTAVFDGVLWGRERFDLHNAVEVPAVLVRLVLILVLVDTQTSLTKLALIVSLTAVSAYVVRMAVAVRLESGIRFGPQLFDKNVMRELLSFGGWFGVLTLTRTALPNAATFAIGYALGPVAVTVFTVPRLLISYANWILASVTQVAAPKAAVLHHAAEGQKQQQLFLQTSCYAMALAVFICAGLLQFGEPFLTLWQPARSGLEYRILVILALAEALPLSQWISYNFIIGMARHRRLAWISAAELTLVFAGSLVGAYVGGLPGVALACAAGAFAFRGVWTAIVAARLLGLDASEYLTRTLGLTALTASLPAVLMMLLLNGWTPATWVQLTAAVTIYCTFYGAALLAGFKLAGHTSMSRPAPIKAEIS